MRIEGMKKIFFAISVLFFVFIGNSYGQKQPSPKHQGKERAKLKREQEEKAQANHEKRVKFHEEIQTQKTKRRIKKHKKQSDRSYNHKNPYPWYKRLFKKRKKVKKHKKRGKY